MYSGWPEASILRRRAQGETRPFVVEKSTGAVRAINPKWGLGGGGGGGRGGGAESDTPSPEPGFFGLGHEPEPSPRSPEEELEAPFDWGGVRADPTVIAYDRYQQSMHKLMPLVSSKAAKAMEDKIKGLLT